MLSLNALDYLSTGNQNAYTYMKKLMHQTPQSGRIQLCCILFIQEDGLQGGIISSLTKL